MTLRIAGATGCDHPEDQLGPLPYDGKPADPDEWECGACGYWNMKDPTEAVDDGRVHGFAWVPRTPWNTPHTDPSAVFKIDVTQATRNINDAMRNIGKAFSVPLTILGSGVESVGAFGTIDRAVDAMRRAEESSAIEQEVQSRLRAALDEEMADTLLSGFTVTKTP